MIRLRGRLRSTADRARFGRVGRAVVADGIGRLDFQVEPFGDGWRDVPDELAGVVEPVGDRLATGHPG